MSQSPQPFLYMLRDFPRSHLLATLALVGIVALAIFLPRDGRSIPAEHTETVALELPTPAKTAVTVDSEQPPVADPLERKWTEITVKSGDTLSRLLQDQGVNPGAIHNLVTADPALKKLAQIRPGETFRVKIDRLGRLLALEYRPTRVKRLYAEYGDGNWTVTEEEREYERQVRYAEAVIDDSLFLAGQSAGMTDSLTMNLAGIFGWDIDFALDIRKGDHFRVLFEELYLDGEKVGHGEILMAEFWNDGRKVTAFRFTDSEGNTDYMDLNGNSLRKEFLRTPVAFSRISSRFNLNRKHPVLNKIRAHRGIDYAAPRGTPVKAAGDGKVIFAGNKGGYGRVVILQHGQKYTTLYAHLNGYARGIRSGKRVRQGQTIGYVGSSGLATGPHLHYEFRLNGVHRNPLTVPLPKARGIPDSERTEFLVHANKLRNQMALHAEAFTLAQNDISQ